MDIYELAEDIVLHLKIAAEKRGIELLLEGEHVVVRGVRQVLYEMFYNIADNAIRYTDERERCWFLPDRMENIPVIM